MRADHAQTAGIIGAAVTDLGLTGHIVEVQPTAVLGLYDALCTQDRAIFFFVSKLAERLAKTFFGKALRGLNTDVVEHFISIMAVMMVMMLVIVIMMVIVVMMMLVMMLMLVFVMVMMMVVRMLRFISFMLSTPQYENWAVAAINTLTKRYSSCYGAWAVCKAMLDVCGIDNICVVRDVSNSYENFHYWCLVYLNGEWYHCDAQKYFNGVAPSGYFCFMMTDREIYNAPTNHRFVEDEYPERSTTSVQSYINVYNGSISSGFPYIDE